MRQAAGKQPAPSPAGKRGPVADGRAQRYSDHEDSIYSECAPHLQAYLIAPAHHFSSDHLLAPVQQDGVEDQTDWKQADPIALAQDCQSAVSCALLCMYEEASAFNTALIQVDWARSVQQAGCMKCSK